eukprot:CAMPEP_0197547244 /NCGR_PEP_ID=MMETSP1320-20131121/1641_1 /TAXON_ID=91990 /ORGANISM="Bolidomonas sp., Strain RCC2347" /LENGTH=229 /DNA_ID=CAMNT_0043106987 /DNA_START=25 /DNA_END=711 /DNA_ORIENTATION=-
MALDASDVSALLSVWPEAVVSDVSASISFFHPPSGVSVSVAVATDVSCKIDTKSKELRKLLLSFQGKLCEELRALKADMQEAKEEQLTVYMDLFANASEKFQTLIEEVTEEDEGDETAAPTTAPAVITHGLEGSACVISVMYSHHIIAKSKLVLIKSLFKTLELRGIMLKGWPGAIVVEGTVAMVDTFVGEMKTLKWKRFVERGRIELKEGERHFEGFFCVEETKAFSL